MQNSAHSSGLGVLVRELDLFILARYPPIAISTFENMRFRRLMNAVPSSDTTGPRAGS